MQLEQSWSRNSTSLPTGEIRSSMITEKKTTQKKKQSLFLVKLRAEWRSSKYQFYSVVGFIRPGLELTIYHTRGEHANNYTTDGD